MKTHSCPVDEHKAFIWQMHKEIHTGHVEIRRAYVCVRVCWPCTDAWCNANLFIIARWSAIILQFIRYSEPNAIARCSGILLDFDN